jgi:monovalent cation/hydrogen antiporter
LITLFGISLVVLITVILVRIGWVFATGALVRWRNRLAEKRLAQVPRAQLERLQARPERGRGRFRRDRRDRFEIMPPFSWRESLVIAWTGMRGVVTLAAAAGIPLLTVTGEAFPGRDVIQAVAFVVTIGTLLLQGLTLPWLIRTLGISDPEEAKTRTAQTLLAEELARQASVEAATRFRDEQTDDKSRRVADAMLKRMSRETDPGTKSGLDGSEPVMMKMANVILAARRAAMVKARDDRELDDEVMREVLEQMDLEQAVVANWTPGRFGSR